MMPVEKRTPIVANIFGRWLALLFIAKTLLPVNVQQKMPTPSTSAHQAEVIRSRHQIIETKQDPLPEQISAGGLTVLGLSTSPILHCGPDIVSEWRSG